MAVLYLSAAMRKKLRTTNMVERLNEEVRRRERVVRVFPIDVSAYRLIGAVLADINDAWSEGIYLNFGGWWDADLVAIDSDLISAAVA